MKETNEMELDLLSHVSGAAICESPVRYFQRAFDLAKALSVELIAAEQEIKRLEDKVINLSGWPKRSLDEALNSGDGSYKP